jgi:hypothetical protein
MTSNARARGLASGGGSGSRWTRVTRQHAAGTIVSGSTRARGLPGERQGARPERARGARYRARTRRVRVDATHRARIDAPRAKIADITVATAGPSHGIARPGGTYRARYLPGASSTIIVCRTRTRRRALSRIKGPSTACRARCRADCGRVGVDCANGTRPVATRARVTHLALARGWGATSAIRTC